MRLWSIHPRFLDSVGLVALWREGLLAQKVLRGETKGYKNHPQLDRFKQTDDPVGYLNNYLSVVYAEAVRRGFNFDYRKIGVDPSLSKLIEVSSGQILFEFEHLQKKLKIRNPKQYDWNKRYNDYISNVQQKDFYYFLKNPRFQQTKNMELEPWEKV